MVAELFGVFWDVIVPVVGIPLLGYVFGKKTGIEAKSLSKMSYYFLVPAFVFTTFAEGREMEPGFLKVVGVCAIIHLLVSTVSYSAAAFLRRDSETRSAYVIATVFPNVGNFSIPLILFRYSESVMVSAIALFLVIVILSFAVCVFFADRKSGIGKGLLSIAKTPAIVAFLVAIAFSWSGVSVPLAVERIFSLMGDAMIAVMLFCIGIQLAEIPAFKIDADVLLISFIKLAVSPMLALGVLAVIPVGESYRALTVIDYAMPTAVLSSMIAMEYGVAAEKVTLVVLLTTLGSAFTLTFFLAAL